MSQQKTLPASVVVQFEIDKRSQSAAFFATRLPACSSRFILIRRMIGIMMDVNNISERLSSLKHEMSDLRVATARYWNRKEHTALDKSAFALRHDRLVQIKQELADMMKRCA